MNRGYTHNESFPKHNRALIDCNLFCREEYRCISGVLFTEANLYEDYTTENTWLFLNPFVTVEIHQEDFPGMVYWSSIDGEHYSPWCDGKRL